MTASKPAVVWSPLGDPGSEPPTAEGLRERKKRLLRQQLSDTATQMFMERGFDGVRVSEVAEACQVSEKTVFNYFQSLTRYLDGIRTPAQVHEAVTADVRRAARRIDAGLSSFAANRDA